MNGADAKGAQVLFTNVHVFAHGHLSLAAASVPYLLTELPDYIAIVTATQAGVMLMNGVTTARDMAGAVFGVKKAIDEGLIPGPRIYPSGPMICQTSGHLDFRFPNQANPSLGGPVPTSDLNHYSALVDGVPKMLATAREQLGVVKEGAYADLLVTEGNPLEDLTEVTNRDHLKIIMKDGQIRKNAVRLERPVSTLACAEWWLRRSRRARARWACGGADQGNCQVFPGLTQG
jgi:imidazolonepropionase-like amidohydrolase